MATYPHATASMMATYPHATAGMVATYIPPCYCRHVGATASMMATYPRGTAGTAVVLQVSNTPHLATARGATNEV